MLMRVIFPGESLDLTRINIDTALMKAAIVQ
jgi:hypothetical protein